MGIRGPLPKLRRPPDGTGARLTRAPAMPDDLSESEQAHWRALVPGIVKLGMVAAVDSPLLRELVRSLARLEAAEADVTLRGLLVPGDRGLVRNPSCLIAREYRAAVLALSARFGLSPVDRERLRLTLASAERAERKVDRPLPSKPAEDPDPRELLRPDPRDYLRAVGDKEAG